MGFGQEGVGLGVIRRVSKERPKSEMRRNYGEERCYLRKKFRKQQKTSKKKKKQKCVNKIDHRRQALKNQDLPNTFMKRVYKTFQPLN